jgi:beta-mannanase
VQLGASGAYDGYAVELAQNLVKDGLGDSIIRLGHEANGTWYKDSLGSTQADYNAWRTYWARIVTAMRSVPGADFQFDWTISEGYRPIPLADWYPGTNVVDIIGIDAYDSQPGQHTYASQAAQWNAVYSESEGVADVIAFAEANGKPLSIPEWGLVSPSNGGAGDNPAYVDGIASVVKHDLVRYQSYFNRTSGGVLPLQTLTASLAAYRSHFGTGGDAVGP